MTMADADIDENVDPLATAAAGPPAVIGGGCMARFDPQQLNAESGVDFSSAIGLQQRDVQEG